MHYRTFSHRLTWIGQKAKRYHNLNALLHAYRTFSVSLAWFGTICNALPQFAGKFMKKYIYSYLKKMRVTHGNALQIAQNQTDPQENIR